MNLTVAPATLDHVEEASQCLATAFAADPVINFLFHTHPAGIRLAAKEFFSLLLRVRISLDMPALILKDGAVLVGAAMGYNTQRVKWPQQFQREWTLIESNIPGVAQRFEVYERISTLYRPMEPHYYLGVIGIHPSAQGKGAGKALLEGFCALSSTDPSSSGVYLETASPESLKFYYRCSFILRGQGSLEGTPLWCVFRSNG